MGGVDRVRPDPDRGRRRGLSGDSWFRPRLRRHRLGHGDVRLGNRDRRRTDRPPPSGKSHWKVAAVRRFFLRHGVPDRHLHRGCASHTTRVFSGWPGSGGTRRLDVRTGFRCVRDLSLTPLSHGRVAFTAVESGGLDGGHRDCLAVDRRGARPIGVRRSADAGSVALDGSKPLLLALEGGGFYLLIVAILASVASLVVRYRRAVGEERQQLKWVALGVVLLGLGVVGSAVWEFVNGAAELGDDTENLVIAVSLTAVPISIGFAYLRYRLYDIDRIISRTLSYGVLTVLLAGAYVGLVFVLRELLPFQGSLPVAISTLGVAAAFNPLRRKVQSFVDQRFNRSRYDAARVIDGFAATAHRGRSRSTRPRPSRGGGREHATGVDGALAPPVR